ncbi:hypothetical protein T07_11103 [Trichinella nelsoni]|uniref:Uncharacterized protein n=1 Tax=Trichinella nelsoni TaxID=6336 RepID=A0A0V0RRB1_9BILA|nr:hypothetical protein T07_11103 [Trichinella nelsoni]
MNEEIPSATKTVSTTCGCIGHFRWLFIFTDPVFVKAHMVDQGGKNWPCLICLSPTGIVHWSAGQLNETRFQEPLLTKSYWPGSSSSSGNWAPWTLSLTAFYFNHITINGPNAACDLLTAARLTRLAIFPFKTVTINTSMRGQYAQMGLKLICLQTWPKSTEFDLDLEAVLKRGCFASCLVEHDGRVCVIPATICPNAAKVALKYTTRITLLTKVGAFSRSN